MESSPPVYMKQCPALGLDLGFWIFKSKEMSPEDLGVYCGYDTHFDETIQKCVPRDTPVCSAVEIPSGATDEEANAACTAGAGCTANFEGTACTATFLSCTIDAAVDQKEEACAANPNCKWNPMMNDCTLPMPDIFFGPKALTVGCDGKTADFSELCGDGTEYGQFMNQCNIPFSLDIM